jgi:PAS domain S-box-containing protein
MRDAIIESESKFRTLFLSAKVGIVFYQPDLKIVDINPFFLEFTGLTYDDVITQSFYSLISENCHSEFNQRFTKLKECQKLGYWEFMLKCKDRYVYVEGSDSQIELGGKVFYVSVLTDVTERKNYQQQIFEAILETEEKERRRFAGDLHDELGPQLASMRIYASSLKKRTDNPEALAITDELMDIIKKSISNVREISNNLSPHLVETYGLAVAIEAEIKNKQSFFSIGYEQNINRFRFDPKIEIVFYRICKELLNNTLKYAQASKVYIKVAFDNNLLKMTYLDDGKGFDFNNYMHKQNKGLGLLNIQSRMNSLNGSFDIQSKAGEGFIAVFYVPAEII